jgi:hypothetical protein
VTSAFSNPCYNIYSHDVKDHLFNNGFSHKLISVLEPICPDSPPNQVLQPLSNHPFTLFQPGFSIHSFWSFSSFAKASLISSLAEPTSQSHEDIQSKKNYGHPWLYMSDFPSFCDVCLQMFTGLKPKSIHHCRNTFRSSNVASWNIRHFVPATFDTGYPRPGILSHDGRREPWTILDPRF